MKSMCLSINTSDLLASMSFVVSLISAWVSYKIYRRDEGGLEFSLRIGMLHAEGDSNNGREGVFFRIANRGRRPVTVCGALVENDGVFRRLLFRHFPMRYPGRWMVLPNNVVVGFLLNINGSFRTFEEGEAADQVAYFPEADGLARSLATEARQLYVHDTLGRRYFVSRKVHRRFRDAYQLRSLRKIADG